MSTQSSFAYSATLGGWERPVPMLLIDDQSPRSGSPAKSIASGPLRPTLLPVTDPTTSGRPTTGGSHPIIDPVLQPESPVVTSTGHIPTPWVRMDGSTVVINGRHHVEKRHLALIGGGLVGAALLYKLIL